VGNGTDDIQNCDWKFDFQCPQKWSLLSKTGDPNVRACGVCLQNVYRCDSPEQIVMHGSQRHCVAIFSSRADEDDDSFATLGSLVPFDDDE
jgi:hypothetical protein